MAACEHCQHIETYGTPTLEIALFETTLLREWAKNKPRMRTPFLELQYAIYRFLVGGSQGIANEMSSKVGNGQVLVTKNKFPYNRIINVVTSQYPESTLTSLVFWYRDLQLDICLSMAQQWLGDMYGGSFSALGLANDYNRMSVKEFNHTQFVVKTNDIIRPPSLPVVIA